MRGCTGSHGVLQWSLSGSMGSYKGIQYQVRGLAGSQGTDQWSLDGSMDYGALWLYYGVPRCCHKRGYTGFQGAVHWSLSGSRGSYGVPPLLPQEGLYRLPGCCSLVFERL